MIIASVEKVDLPDLKEIVSICIPLMDEVPDEEKPHVQKLILENIEVNLELEKNSYLKAVANNRTIGFILIKGHEKLSELFVLPEYRNRGIGSILLKAGISDSIGKSHSNHIWVNAALNAVPFYKKHGFINFTTNEKRFSFVERLEYRF